MKWLLNFPARKFCGVLFAFLGGLFTLAFLLRALIGWGDIPDGVIGLVGILTSGFGVYAVGSNYEATHKHYIEPTCASEEGE